MFACTTKMTQEAQYPHGHHPSVLRSHRWRTVSNSAAYLLPHIKPTHKILDVGCGPGTISCDFANQVPQGSVTGIDSAESIVSDAKRLAQEQGIRNVSFKTGNVFSLPFEDDEFDIVHAHQVLQHVADPAAALREMKRVAKQGTGIVAVRDMSHFLHYPEVKELKVFTELFWEVARRNHAVPGFGCMLKRFTREAGFKSEDVTITAGTWCFCTKEDLEWWCGRSMIVVRL